MFVSKDVRIRGYFSQPKRLREQTILRNTAVKRYWHTEINFVSSVESNTTSDAYEPLIWNHHQKLSDAQQ
jgi:hypothetical protein